MARNARVGAVGVGWGYHSRPAGARRRRRCAATGDALIATIDAQSGDTGTSGVTEATDNGPKEDQQGAMAPRANLPKRFYKAVTVARSAATDGQSPIA